MPLRMNRDKIEPQEVEIAGLAQYFLNEFSGEMVGGCTRGKEVKEISDTRSISFPHSIFQ
jgi:hypothetical protein